jgi:hypothetical protein
MTGHGERVPKNTEEGGEGEGEDKSIHNRYTA